jgi:hypothetical protein
VNLRSLVEPIIFIYRVSMSSRENLKGRTCENSVREE